MTFKPVLDDDQRAALLEDYKTETMKVLRLRYRVSARTIYRLASHHGMVKRRWLLPNAAAKAEFIRLYPTTPNKVLAEMFGTNVRAVQKAGPRLGLHKLCTNTEVVTKRSPPMAERFAPAAGSFGAGFAAAGIGRDVYTGRAWGQGA